jgi:hypothetical protein
LPPDNLNLPKSKTPTPEVQKPNVEGTIPEKE